VLAFFVWKFSNRQANAEIKTLPGGAKGLVIAALVLVGTEMLALGILGQKAWASVYFTPAKPDALQVQAQAGQFAFYFRYPGADGKFGALRPDKIDEGNSNFFGLDPANDVDSRDDIVTGELAIPINREVHLMMHAKDVGHSFYVRELRIQQDFVPGLDPLHCHQGWQVRNRVHAALWSRSLQHEGVSERIVPGGFRRLDETEGFGTIDR
jgi:heme/copper-type cytochrome/quinol oxidase subunit 2